MWFLDLYSPVTALQGIGPTRAKQLQALGIETIYDLMAYFPRLLWRCLLLPQPCG